MRTRYGCSGCKLELAKKSLLRIICSLGAGLLALVSFIASQPASAQTAASRSDPARNQAVHNGDRAPRRGAFLRCTKALHRSLRNQINGQARQRARRFHGYEGANRRRAKATIWLSASCFTKACTTLKDAKACAIVKEKAADLKDDIDRLERNANLNRVSIQNTVNSRYKELRATNKPWGIGLRRSRRRSNKR